MITTTSAKQLLRATVVALLLLLLVHQNALLFAHALIDCTKDAFSHTCLDQVPVCCFYPANDGAIAGCCPVGTECDLEHKGCKAMPPLPSGERAENLTPLEIEVHMSTREAVGIAFLVVLTLVAAFVFVFLLGVARDYAALRRERRQRRLLEEDKDDEDEELPSDDESVSSNTERDFLSEQQNKFHEAQGAIEVFGSVSVSQCLRKEEGEECENEANNDEEGGSATDTSATAEGECSTEQSAAARSANRSAPTKQDRHHFCCFVCKGTETGHHSSPTTTGGGTVTAKCLFLDCHHVCSCIDCAAKLRYCPYCHKKIRRRVKVFTM